VRLPSFVKRLTVIGDVARPIFRIDSELRDA
jgi:hypothetical protein